MEAAADAIMDDPGQDSDNSDAVQSGGRHRSRISVAASNSAGGGSSSAHAVMPTTEPGSSSTRTADFPTEMDTNEVEVESSEAGGDPPLGWVPPAELGSSDEEIRSNLIQLASAMFAIGKDASLKSKDVPPQPGHPSPLRLVAMNRQDKIAFAARQDLCFCKTRRVLW